MSISRVPISESFILCSSWGGVEVVWASGAFVNILIPTDEVCRDATLSLCLQIF